MSPEIDRDALIHPGVTVHMLHNVIQATKACRVFDRDD
jgi:hypothetical protein